MIVAVAHFFDSAISRSVPSTRLIPTMRISSGAIACQSIVGADQLAGLGEDARDHVT